MMGVRAAPRMGGTSERKHARCAGTGEERCRMERGRPTLHVSATRLGGGGVVESLCGAFGGGCFSRPLSDRVPARPGARSRCATRPLL
jgi:hypothetical protein